MSSTAPPGGGVPTSAPLPRQVADDPGFPFPSHGASSQSVSSGLPPSSGIQTSSSTASDTRTFFPFTFSTSTSATKSTSPKSTSHDKNAIIGGVIGGVVGLLTVTTLLMYYLRRRSHVGKITAFKVSPDTSAEPMSEARLQAGPHPPQATPNISTTVSGSSMPVDSQHMIDKTANRESSPTIAISQGDSLIDQSMPHPNRSSPELVRSTLPLPIISHNQRNLDPLLREIMNAAQGRNQNSLDPNVPQNFQIFIINQNRDGSVANENEENRGVGHYDRSPPRNMDIDALGLPPSYEQVSSI